MLGCSEVDSWGRRRGLRAFQPIRRFLLWWRGELASLVPERLAAWFTGAPRARRLVFERGRSTVERVDRAVHLPFGLPPDGAALEAAAKAIGQGGVVDVTWPADAALVRRHDLPAAARGRVASILELDLARATPLRREEIEWRFDVRRRPEGGLAVRQYILKRADIDAFAAALRRAGLALRRLELAGPDGAPLAPFVDRARALARPARLWRWTNAALLAACLGLAVYLAAAPHFARRAELTALRAETDALRTRAVALRQTVEQAAARREATEALKRVFAETPPTIEVLRELTLRLPDSVWLSELHVSDRDARFSGFVQGSAAELVIALGDSALLVNPRLTGPVSISPSDGAERFEIAADLGSGR